MHKTFLFFLTRKNIYRNYSRFDQQVFSDTEGNFRGGSSRGNAPRRARENPLPRDSGAQCLLPRTRGVLIYSSALRTKQLIQGRRPPPSRTRWTLWAPAKQSRPPTVASRVAKSRSPRKSSKPARNLKNLPFISSDRFVGRDMASMLGKHFEINFHRGTSTRWRKIYVFYLGSLGASVTITQTRSEKRSWAK